jgi:hypothetical protein
MVRILAIVAVAGVIVSASTAEAQIVRRIIGHAVAGKAVKSILGEDKGASGQDADADASDRSSAPGAGVADSAAAPESVPAQTPPDRQR